jgi:hypothetical protein
MKNRSEELEKRIAEAPPPVADEIIREKEQSAKGRLEVKQQQKEAASPVFKSTPTAPHGRTLQSVQAGLTRRQNGC